jgi:hypothetical protein
VAFDPGVAAFFSPAFGRHHLAPQWEHRPFSEPHHDPRHHRAPPVTTPTGGTIGKRPALPGTTAYPFGNPLHP